eukprot:GHRQ01011906.1.p1 GENE.GHRQ01011906.1~~GHRQ01011906.1.p1  ORF type:complete len:242 (+),score=78.58 GHRQ01011906.1:975-1700(+)
MRRCGCRLKACSVWQASWRALRECAASAWLTTGLDQKACRCAAACAAAMALQAQLLCRAQVQPVPSVLMYGFTDAGVTSIPCTTCRHNFCSQSRFTLLFVHAWLLLHLLTLLAAAANPQRLCEAMRLNNSVRMLDLQDNSLGDAGACTLAALMADGARFNSLQLAANDIGDSGMVALAEAISKARCLEKLSLYHNNIGTRGCQVLTAAVLATPALKVRSGVAAHGEPGSLRVMLDACICMR